ncbi:MAG: hypothetical protein ACE5GM_10570 [bacterium]
MFPKNNLKNKLIDEINQLPEDSFESVYHILHSLRVELTKKRRLSRKSFSKKFLSTCGAWEDTRTAREIMDEISNARVFSQKNIEW